MIPLKKIRNSKMAKNKNTEVSEVSTLSLLTSSSVKDGMQRKAR